MTNYAKQNMDQDGREVTSEAEKKKNVNKGNKDFKSKKRRGGSGNNSQSMATEGANSSTTKPTHTGNPMLDDACAVPFSWPVGVDLDLRNVNFNFTGLSNVVAPGIMTINVHNIPGISTHQNDAVNIAKRALYTFVRHLNSGRKNYDAPDLMLYILAMDSFISNLTYFSRVYGYIHTFNMYSRYLPEGIVRALGCDYDDLVSDSANFRFHLNAIITKASNLCVPKFPFIEEHRNVGVAFQDNPSPKHQIYVVKPMGYYVFEAKGSKGGHLVYKAYPENMGVSKMMEVLNEQINAILQNEDMNIMSAEILKAYGKDELISFSLLIPDGPEGIVYSDDLLSIVQNAVALGKPEADSMNITQNPNVGAGEINFNPSWVNDNGGMHIALSDYILTANSSEISPAEVYNMTRWTNILYKDGSTKYRLRRAGLQIVEGYTIYTADVKTNKYKVTDIKHQLYLDGHSNGGKLSTSDVADAMNTITYLTKFNKHPDVLQIVRTGASTYGRFSVQDLNFTAVVDIEILARIHEFGVLATFNTPGYNLLRTN